MTDGKPDSYWPGADERLVVEEMIRDRNSQHWEACSNFVKRRVRAKAKNIPVHHQEDISQQIMVKITKSLPTFHFDCSFGTWLFTITERSIIDMHRKLQVQAPFSLPLGEPSKEDEREGEIMIPNPGGSAEEVYVQIDDLRNAVNTLREYIGAHANPDRNRTIIEMVILDGRTLEEAAKVVGCSAPVAGYVVREAKRYVREKMGYRL